MSFKALSIWVICVAMLIGYQLLSQSLPFLQNYEMRDGIVFIVLLILLLATRFMKRVPKNSLFIAKENSSRRNILNILNFSLGASAATSMCYMSGLFGNVSVMSAKFYTSICLFSAYVLFEILYIILTENECNGVR
jgi:hypothetical protein